MHMTHMVILNGLLDCTKNFILDVLNLILMSESLFFVSVIKFLDKSQREKDYVGSQFAGTVYLGGEVLEAGTPQS